MLVSSSLAGRLMLSVRPSQKLELTDCLDWLANSSSKLSVYVPPELGLYTCSAMSASLYHGWGSELRSSYLHGVNLHSESISPAPCESFFILISLLHRIQGDIGGWLGSENVHLHLSKVWDGNTVEHTSSNTSQSFKEPIIPQLSENKTSPYLKLQLTHHVGCLRLEITQVASSPLFIRKGRFKEYNKSNNFAQGLFASLVKLKRAIEFWFSNNDSNSIRQLGLPIVL